MNKQEAIEKIEELKKYSCGALGDDWISLGIDKALNVVKQIDEPEKPVVPQFVADWYEGHKRSLEWTLRQLGLDMMNGVFDDTEMKGWLNDSKNKPFETLVKMKLYDYDVKKEKLYTARLKLLTSKKYSFINKDKVEDKLIISGPDDVNGLYQVHFTQAELEGLGVWDNPAFETEEVK